MLAAGASHTCGLSSAGRLFSWGDAYKVAAVRPERTWRSVSTSVSRTCAISAEKESIRIYIWDFIESQSLRFLYARSLLFFNTLSVRIPGLRKKTRPLAERTRTKTLAHRQSKVRKNFSKTAPPKQAQSLLARKRLNSRPKLEVGTARCEPFTKSVKQVASTAPMLLTCIPLPTWLCADLR